MKKKVGEKWFETTSYLPEEFAKKGWIIDLKQDDDSWDRGWEVISVGKVVDNPPDWRKLIRGHRKMTGDSNPR